MYIYIYMYKQIQTDPHRSTKLGGPASRRAHEHLLEIPRCPRRGDRRDRDLSSGGSVNGKTIRNPSENHS